MATTRLECFRTTIQKNFQFLKQVNTVDDLWAKAISVEKGIEGFWVPVADFHLANPNFKNELLNFFQNVKIHDQAGFTAENFLAKVAALSETQLALFYVDKFGNKLAFLCLEPGNIEKFEIQLSHLTLSAACDTAILTKPLKVLASWLNSSFVADSVTAPLSSFSGIEKVGFIKKGSHYVFAVSTDELGKTEILTAGPSISSQEVSYVLDAARYGWNGEWSKYIKKFETEFANYIGVQHALSTSSCTGALHIALKALGIGPGDEVIVPDITWVATASAVDYVGATAVFAEIDADNWCMDPTKLEALITKKTKCIIPVHLYGHPAEMDKIMEIANRHNLYVIEDAAPAVGAECRGRKVGTFGHFATFSFQGAKLLVTGEGGMLVTNDTKLFEKAYAVWDHGRTPGTFWINQVGLKYKMANVLAAMGLGQIERVEEQIHAKRRILNWYNEEIGTTPGIKLLTESTWARSICWLSSVLIDSQLGLTRDEFFEKLKAFKIDTRPAFPAISRYPMWKPSENKIAMNVGDWGVNLPSGVCLNEEQVRYVGRSIKKIILGYQ